MTSPGRRESADTVLAYSGGVIDRAANQRTEPGWVDATLASSSTRLIPMWRDQCVVSGEPAVPVIVPAGTIVCFSSNTFHRSGANTTKNPRRSYLCQYSPKPILKKDSSGPWCDAVPFLKDGRNIFQWPSPA